MNRLPIATLGVSGVALIGLLVAEGYRDKAYIPVAGDVPTIGFGTTQGVRPGDTITVPQALTRATRDVQKFEGAIKSCVKVPLYQYEYDAYVSLTYNIGEGVVLVKRTVGQVPERRSTTTKHARRSCAGTSSRASHYAV